MNARYRAKDDRQVRHVHTLNGSGVAVGRALDRCHGDLSAAGRLDRGAGCAAAAIWAALKTIEPRRHDRRRCESE